MSTYNAVSMIFNGTSQFGLLNQPITFGGAITLECWVLLSNVATWPRIIDFANGVSGLDAVMSGFYTGLNQLWIQTTTSARLDLSSATVPLNTWTHVAFTVSATGTAKCYVNASLAQSGTVAVIPSKARTIPYWGKSSFAGESLFPGKMTELRFWTTERTASEISTNWKTALLGTESGLLLYISDYALRNRVGNVITSQSPGAYTMTMASTVSIDPAATFQLTSTPVVGYKWSSSNGATAITTPTTLAPKTSLSAGVYTLTITDSALATKSVIYTITDPYIALAMTTPGTVTHATYYGGATGSITAPTIAGNGIPFKYSWTSSGTIATNVSTIATGNLTFIAAGTYVLTVTDSTLRTVTTSYTVAHPIILTATQTDITTVSPTGTCTVSALGGLNTSYVYAWKKAGSAIAPTTAAITGLTAGQYQCTVTNSTFTAVATFEIATYLTTTLSPTSVRAAWTAITGALNYRVYYTVSGTTTRVLYTPTTLALFAVISNLTPQTSYLVEVYSTVDGVNYVRSFASTVVLPVASVDNFSKDTVLAANSTYDITALQTSTNLGGTPAALVQTAFANGDLVIASATAQGSTITETTQVLKRLFNLSLDKNGQLYLPFDATLADSVVQQATLTLSDGSTTVVSFVASTNSIIVNGVTYSIGNSLVIDGQTSRVYSG
jgi:hypothetical protein